MLPARAPLGGANVGVTQHLAAIDHGGAQIVPTLQQLRIPIALEMRIMALAVQADLILIAIDQDGVRVARHIVAKVSQSTWRQLITLRREQYEFSQISGRPLPDPKH